MRNFPAVIKTPIFLSICTIISLIILWGIGPGYGFSSSTEPWSHFGSFFGGILSPVFAFLALVIAMKSIKAQQHSNSLAAKNYKEAQEQAERNLHEQRVLQVEKVNFERQSIALHNLLDSFQALEPLFTQSLYDLRICDVQHSILGANSNAYIIRSHSVCLKAGSFVKRMLNEKDTYTAKLIRLCVCDTLHSMDNLIEHIELYKNPFLDSNEVNNVSQLRETRQMFYSLKEKLDQHLKQNQN
ncbi:hypothetical protein [Pseudoalteromonas sp. S2755]|uniref:hypothetical protein n=1 Tax=Pseudoalteromonas sp. S2755 TaxID=2066523 RepID=UPI001276D851|nr:hypothetical protein [Pseudoalteromonas sp. S2755]TMN39088.1 hypothetical protein CWC03_10370 [Pseudoalteromonas sp. S2755]